MPETAPLPPPPRPLSARQQEDRLRFILEAQEHCDHFLTTLCAPAGKSVVVLGAGAGTEMLWCLRHGAREVVGIDILEQDPLALERAVAQLGLSGRGTFAVHTLPIERAEELGRRFDLVLSNNVVEHVPDLQGALRICARLVAPAGRVAIFTDPLYYSSAGSHLPLEPWEHLWGAPEQLRERLRAAAALPAGHALEVLELRDYLDREISLNRMRLVDFIDAVRASGLVFLNLRLLRDRHLDRLGASLDQLEAAAQPLAPADLAIEGLAAELALPTAFEHPDGAHSTEERRTAARFQELGRLAAELRADLENRYAEIGRLDAALRQSGAELATARAGERSLSLMLRAVEASPSFRLGRALTAPARWLRATLRRQG